MTEDKEYILHSLINGELFARKERHIGLLLSETQSDRLKLDVYTCIIEGDQHLAIHQDTFYPKNQEELVDIVLRHYNEWISSTDREFLERRELLN